MLVLPANLENALEIFNKSLVDGFPVVFPTDTIYGIGAPIASVKANETIYEIKKRDRAKPFPILAGSVEQAKALLAEGETVDTAPLRTRIYRAADNLPELYKKDGTVAVRLVKNGWLGETLRMIGAITATSVNTADSPPLLTAEEIYQTFSNALPYMLWSESGSVQSEIVGLNGERIR
jgi:L-threonylcarbamoyladenylate synthase